MSVGRLFLCGSLLLVSASMAACAQQGNATLPMTAQQLQVQQAQIVNPDAGPPACKGQTDGKGFASLKITLSSKGGSFCIPAIDGFGGTLSYPKANPSAKATVISSDTNYKSFPELGKGTAIFYLQVLLAGGTTFGNKIRPTGGLSSTTITAGKSYTAFGQATISGAKVNFGPCVSVATKGKFGGVIGSLGGLFEYAVVPGKTNSFIEIYSGAQTKTKC